MTGNYLLNGYNEVKNDYSSDEKKLLKNINLIFENLKWMTTSEAAIYLRMSANALRTAVCRGQIVPKKFRRRLYFKRSDLDSLIETSNNLRR